MMSRTCPSGFGPGNPGRVRHAAAAARIAAIWSSVRARGCAFRVRSEDVPSTGLRSMASCRSAKAKIRFSRVRDCFARDGDLEACDRRCDSTRPVVISAKA
jgi:hypothetical protein